MDNAWTSVFNFPEKSSLEVRYMLSFTLCILSFDPLFPILQLLKRVGLPNEG